MVNNAGYAYHAADLFVGAIDRASNDKNRYGLNIGLQRVTLYANSPVSVAINDLNYMKSSIMG